MQGKSFLKNIQFDKFLPGLTAGLIVGITEVSMEISLAALVFSGLLAPFVGQGIGFFLFGSFILLLSGAIFSPIPGEMNVPQDTPAAILALVTVGIANNMAGSATLDEIFTTVVAAIIVTSVLTGLIFLLFGRYKLSGFARFIPYPVVGGFLAGTGWLLATGGLSVMLDFPLTSYHFQDLFHPDVMVQWLSGSIFAVTLLLILRRSSHFAVIPGTLAISISLFYITLALFGISTSEAASKGWLLGPFEQEALFQPLTLASYSQINWTAISLQADKIAAIVALSLISLLLNASALEIAAKEDLDLNSELRSTGLANIFAGLFGSPVGYQALSLTALAHRLNAKTRVAGIIAALVSGGTLLFGASAISYFPKPILGGILLFLGLSFLSEWVIDARTHLPRIDYLLVLIILFVIASVGFLEGIVVGVLAAVILFVVSYSQINAVKNTLSGSSYRSKVERPLAQRKALLEKGGEIYILRLQGFIFFGTAQNLLDQIKARLENRHLPRLRYVILDFRQVVLLDSSAVFSITRMKQLAEMEKFQMVWANISNDIQKLLEKGGLVDESDDSFMILPTLDHGLEWCENQTLSRHGVRELLNGEERIEQHLKHSLPDLKDITQLMQYLERVEIGMGDYLMRQGDRADEMYFIESGLISVQLELPDGNVLRLRSLRGGTTVGEMGMYLDKMRTASVVADRPSVVYRLSRSELQKIERNESQIAALLHQWIARLLAERLADNNRTIKALLD